MTYGERLADLGPSTLLAVFERSEQECKFFPQIAELREMAGGLTVQGELMEIDRAWFWVNNYLRKHGVEGRDYVESTPVEGECPRCQGTRWITKYREVERNDGKILNTREAIRCDCRHVALREHAPEMPPRLQATLRCMAPSIELALEAIRDCDGKWAAKLRADFNEAYRRAVKAMDVA